MTDIRVIHKRAIKYLFNMYGMLAIMHVAVLNITF